MFQILSKRYIRDFLKSLVLRGTKIKPRNGATMNDIAKYTGIPRASLLWIAGMENARFSKERQRLLSKVIGMIENGILDFEISGRPWHRKKIAVIREHPKPIARYKVKLDGSTPKLKPVERPPAFKPMPSFKDVFSGNLTNRK